MSKKAEDTVRAYVSAWTTADPAERDALLERSWAEDGVYQDPQNRFEGRAGLRSGIEGFRQRLPGVTFRIDSGVDEHHGFLRFHWLMLDPQGKPQTEGFDIGELDDAGRLKRIIGFFGPFPPVSAA